MSLYTVYASGRIDKSPYAAAQYEYLKRLGKIMSLIEYDGEKSKETERVYDIAYNSTSLIICDEKGKNIPSVVFAQKLQHLKTTHNSGIIFLIGPADGLPETVKTRATLSISFGALTWPHLLARILLLEQVYRAEMIMAGHPYHRE